MGGISIPLKVFVFNHFILPAHTAKYYKPQMLYNVTVSESLPNNLCGEGIEKNSYK